MRHTLIWQVQSLLGSPDGSVLRRIAKDIDSTELIERLVAPESSQLRRWTHQPLYGKWTHQPLYGKWTHQPLYGKWTHQP